jgi:nucleolar protein 53
VVGARYEVSVKKRLIMTTNSVVLTDAPKRRQRASKKNKKSWRKNTNLDDVDEYLEDQRLEERLGGAFGDRPDSALFFVEKDAKCEEEEEAPKPLSRLEARKRRAEKPMKCFQQLENTSKVADPKKGRNTRRLPEERENPIVKDMTKRMREQGIIR